MGGEGFFGSDRFHYMMPKLGIENWDEIIKEEGK